MCAPSMPVVPVKVLKKLGKTPQSQSYMWVQVAEPEQLRQWLDKSLPQVPPKTLLSKALHYLHNQWDKLIRYCDEGYLRMDNNLAENAIRPFVVGRKA